jgi:hypothetical protein
LILHLHSSRDDLSGQKTISSYLEDNFPQWTDALSRRTQAAEMSLAREKHYASSGAKRKPCGSFQVDAVSLEQLGVLLDIEWGARLQSAQLGEWQAIADFLACEDSLQVHVFPVNFHYRLRQRSIGGGVEDIHRQLLTEKLAVSQGCQRHFAPEFINGLPHILREQRHLDNIYAFTVNHLALACGVFA